MAWSDKTVWDIIFLRWGNKDNKGRKKKDDGLTDAQRRERTLWRARLMVALALPVFLETLDYTVVATAQPHIASAFNRLDLQSYIGTIYLLTATVFLPPFASICDVYGRHFAMQLSLACFLIGSALSTAAQNMPMMLAGRGIAGIGAAGLLTVVRVILADTSSLNDSNFQQSILTYLYTAGFTLGPFIGGALTSISFRWIFAINLPCCVISMVLVFVLLRSHTKEPGVDQSLGAVGRILLIDWAAVTAFVGGGILLLLGLNWGSSEKWNSVKVIISFVVAAILLFTTIGWEAVLEHKQQKSGMLDGFSSTEALHTHSSRNARLPVIFRAAPLLPLSVLGNYDVLATSFAAFTSGMVMLVVFYFVALFMVIVDGKSATDAGVQLIFFAPGMGVGTMTAITLVNRLRQPKYPIILGSSLIPIGLGLISMGVKSNNEGAVNGYMFFLGIGVGMTFGPLSLHARFSQPASRVAVVVALNLFFRALGGTVGLAQCGAITNARVRHFLDSQPSLLNATSSVSSSDLTSIDQINSLPAAAKTLVQDAFRDGVRWSFISLIPWACVTLIGTFFLRRIVDPEGAAPDSAVSDDLRTRLSPSEGEGYPSPGGHLAPTQNRSANENFEVLEMNDRSSRT